MISASFIFLIWKRFVCRRCNICVDGFFNASASARYICVSSDALPCWCSSQAIQSKNQNVTSLCHKWLKILKIVFCCERSQFYLQEEKVMKKEKFVKVCLHSGYTNSFHFDDFQRMQNFGLWYIPNGKYILLWYFSSNFRTLHCELYLLLFISLNRTEIPKVAPNEPWELRLLWLHCLH